MWSSKQYFTGPVETGIMCRGTLLNYFNAGHEETLRSYSEIVNIPMKRFAKDGNSADLDNKLQSVKSALSTMKFAQLLWSKTLRRESVCERKALSTMLVGGTRLSI